MSRPDRVPARRYYDRDFYEMECELLWPRVWQMACRLEEIPKPGDFVEYENLGQSVIVVRVGPDEVRAFHNACRHRGVKLVEDRGSLPSGFTCPFHGWCWGLDGQNTFLYQPDLFAESNRDPLDLELVECRLEVWGGCAFINFDPDAPGLRDSIEPFASIHDAWRVEALRSEWWLAARLPVNWKLAMEAFMEGYHVMETHPQLLPPWARGKQAVYRTVGDGRASREAQRAGSGPVVESAEFIDRQIHFMRVLSEGMAGMTHEKDVQVAEGLRDLELPADTRLASRTWRSTLNDAIVAWNRSAGIDIPDLNELDAAGITSAVNFCFPHFFLLPTFSSASSYRIRPLGPEETLFELWSLTRYPPGQEPPRPQRPEPMAPDDPRWPPIPTQDFSNLPRQQRGLHARGFEYMRLSDQVEGLIGNYQRLIDGYLAGLSYEKLLPALHLVSGPIDSPLKDLGF
jgi:phenylpropionate dioxygenase-like ring-hydroxylating dioxygenase large terminal subunit